MDEMDALEASAVTEEINMEDLVTEDHSSIEDPLVNLTKAPTPNIPESQVGQSIKTKVDVSNVRNLDISKMSAQPTETEFLLMSANVYILIPNWCHEILVMAPDI